MRSLFIAMLGAIVFGLPEEIQAQARDTTHCCTVVRIDARRAIVTARETATGYTFLIEVRNRKLLAALKIGDKVWASFAVKKVRLEAAGDSLCCPIVETPQTDAPATNAGSHEQGHESRSSPTRGS